MAGKPVESETVVTWCDACGGDFPPTHLMHASVPSLYALAAIGNSEPDDPDHIIGPHLVDRNWYCRSCRLRVTFRRVIGIAVLFLIPLMVARLLWAWWR